MASKRKRRVITLEKKLEIIGEIQKGQSQRRVSELYDIPKSTVADIWKDREKIENFVSASDCPSFAKKRHIVRKAVFEKLDQACYLWFIQQRSKGAPLSGPILKKQALQLFPLIYPDANPDSFKASSGWLQKFSLRHGFQLVSDEEIVEILITDQGACNSGSDEPAPPHKAVVTHAQACDAFECALVWLESHDEVDPAHVLLVKNWRDQAALLRCGETNRPKLYRTSVAHITTYS